MKRKLLNQFGCYAILFGQILVSASAFSQSSAGIITVNGAAPPAPSSTATYGSSYTTPVKYTPPTFEGKVVDVDKTTFSMLKSVLKEFKVVSLDVASLNKFVKDNNYFSQFNLKLGNVSHLLEIQENDLRSRNYRSNIKYLIGDKEQLKDPFESVDQYKGFADGVRNNLVRVTISPQTLSGYIYIKNTNQWLYMEPVKNLISNLEGPTKTLSRTLGVNLLVIYDVTDIINTKGVTCGAQLLPTKVEITTQKDMADPCMPRTLEIATDADYEFYQKYQSGSDGQILSILNQVEGVYSANFNMVFSVTYQHTYATASDPYTTTNPQNALSEFRSNWLSNFSGVQRDVAHLFTGKNIDGGVIGIAYLDAICKSPSIAFGMTQDYYSGGWSRIILTAHEMGHNFSGRHEDGVSCGDDYNSSIMCPTVGKYAYYFSDPEISRIGSFIATYGSCLENENTNNVSSSWLNTWTNDKNQRKLGTWYFNVGDRVMAGDFDGNGQEEFLFVSANATWSTMMRYECGYGSDWYHMWSNMGSHTIATWHMNVGDRYFTGDFNGDGKTDLLSISASSSWATIHTYNNGVFQFAWSNMGNGRIGNWYIHTGTDSYTVGDFDHDGKDELLCFSNNGNGYSSMNNWESNFSLSPYGWSNMGSGRIGGVNIRSTNYYRPGDFHQLGFDELFTVDGKWGTFLRYNSQTNDWDWIWSNYGSSSLSGWGMPLANSGSLYDYVLAGNIDSDSKDELMFIQSGSQAGWATTMDFNTSNNSLNWNWSNYGNAQIDAWNQKGSCNYFLCRNNPAYPAQILAVNVSSSGGSYLYHAEMYRAGHPNNNFRVGRPEQDAQSDVSISLDKENNQFKLYPNPTTGILNMLINLKDANDKYSFSIYNVLGETVFEKQNVSEQSSQIDISSFPKGVYYMKFKHQGEESITKIISE